MIVRRCSGLRDNGFVPTDSAPENPPHVLVCGYERHIVRLIQVKLERQGWRVATASTGQEALDNMRADRPDLLMLESQLPDMSAEEIIQAMREDPDLAGINIYAPRPPR
jgi:DNA-binding response OmpR family regulator